MDFALSENQVMLRDSVARYLDKHYDFAKRTQIVADGGLNAETWQTFADLGWTGACLPEEAGGYGGGSIEAMILMEQFGRHLVVEPFLWTVVIGGQLLRSLPEAQAAPLLERMIAGNLQIGLAAFERHSRHDLSAASTTATEEDGGWVINGVKPMVPNGAHADILFATALMKGELALLRVDRTAPGLTITPFRLQDGQNAAEVRLDRVKVDHDALVMTGGAVVDAIELASDHGRAAQCAAAIGSADYLIAATTAHLKQREQYGAPLAKLQVLQHRLAEMYVSTELGRSMAISAALSIDLPRDQRARAISAARVQVIQALRFVTQQAVQLHGGMGISEELDVAHHFKHAVTSAALLGDEGFHLERFMALDLADAKAA